MVSRGRIAVLGLVLAGLALSAVLPLRTYLEQRSQIAALHEQIASDTSAVAQLQLTAARWQDPAFVRAQARQRLHLIAPGETGYIVTDSGTLSPSPGPVAPSVSTAPRDAVAGGPTSPPAAGTSTPPPAYRPGLAGTGAANTGPAHTGAGGLADLGSANPLWDSGVLSPPTR